MELRGGAKGSLDNVVLPSKGSGINFKLVVPREVQSRVLAMELTLLWDIEFEATIIGPKIFGSEGIKVLESLLVGNSGAYATGAFKSQALGSAVTLGKGERSWHYGETYVIALVLDGSNSTARCFQDAKPIEHPIHIGQVDVLPAQSCVELAFTNHADVPVRIHWIGLWGTAPSGEQVLCFCRLALADRKWRAQPKEGSRPKAC